MSGVFNVWQEQGINVIGVNSVLKQTLQKNGSVTDNYCTEYLNKHLVLKVILIGYFGKSEIYTFLEICTIPAGIGRWYGKPLCDCSLCTQTADEFPYMLVCKTQTDVRKYYRGKHSHRTNVIRFNDRMSTPKENILKKTFVCV
jgi:hypothetical protein